MYTEEELKSIVNSEFKKSVAEYQEKGMALTLKDKTTGAEVNFATLNSENFDASEYNILVACGKQSRNLEVLGINEDYYSSFITTICAFLYQRGESFPRFRDKSSNMDYIFFYSPNVEKGEILLEENSTSTKIIAQSFCEGDLVKIPSSIDKKWSWLSRINFFDITPEERSRIFDVARNLDKLK
jgi:hypothetical protein